jgi:cell division protein FtsI (penicillin-binding protein 3)/stage V sporulation protein D (sporulation-specific penicillin-binding protein)
VALSQRRIGWLLGFFALLLAVAAVRALQLATLNSGRLSSVANEEHVRTVTTPAARGAIVDRNGELLAVTEAADDISATPQLVKNPVAVATALAPLLHVSLASLEQDLIHPAAPDWTPLARQVPATLAARVLKLAIPGVAATPDPRRVYPDDYLAAQVLGGVGCTTLACGIGLSGVELELNRQLSGSPGHQTVVSDGEGQAISVTGPTATPGKTVQLTLDAALNQYTDSVVAATGEAFQAQNATAIVLDPRTGAILALSNWPRVNANDTAKVALSPDYATQQNYEPGSTFKVVAIGGALSDGIISPDTTFTVPDSLPVADRTIHDAEVHPTETLTTRQILARSSNVGAVEIGEYLGDARLYHWIRQFGFGSLTGIDLPGEEQGIVPPVSVWSGSSIGNIPIGQGVSVTPLQIAAAYAAIANGGLLVTPHVVASVGGKPVTTARPRRILTPTVAAELRSMLEGVLSPDGTASEITIPGYTLAGKTGTANKVVDGTYSHTQYYSSFVGFAPAQDPQVEAIVVVNDPKGGDPYGTYVAAPAWQKIMNFALPYLKIAPG